ncbi:MAG: pyridoxal-phosphate dependent enzyme [Candidatus Hodarchaeota archaeon]
MVLFSEIEDAYNRIKGTINHTPVMTSRTLNEMVKGTVYIKCENYQRMGAFKFRGAYNTISQLSKEQKAKGVVTHSSGNHAQAVALASKLLGIKATIVMPDVSPVVKVNATRDTYGATVVMCKNTQQDRESTTQELIDEHGYTLVHPYDNDDVIRGAGTAAYELIQEKGDIDYMFCPVGGGGLLSGTAIATKGCCPSSKVIAVEPELANDAYRSFKEKKLLKNESTPRTIADGLRTNLSERTFKIIIENVDQIILVSEREILDALRFIWERMKMIVEPSGAVPLAGVLSGQLDLENKRIGVIISGGNIDLGAFFKLLEEKLPK